MTPAELAQLTEQNAELTSQLEDLEREATKSDEAAKRKLGKLEQEIERLKGDLDSALELLQQKEREIEMSSEAKRQRLEREERLLALREKQQQQHQQQGVLDYSPPSIPVPRFNRFAADESQDERVAFPSEPHNAEVDLISRLMDKIKELEETNQEISKQQNASVRKLRKAMIGAEGMRKVYDYLSDDEDLEVEIVDEDEFTDAFEHPARGSLGSVPEEDLPMRFSSLRRTINEDIHKRLATELSEDEGHHLYGEMEHHHSRSRGTVVGLFDAPERHGRNLPLTYSQDEDEDEDDLDESMIFSRAVSPIGSPLLIPQEPPGHIRSLGSELGPDYLDDLEGSTSDHRHTRNTSVFSLSALVADTPPNRMSHGRSTSLTEGSPTPPSKRPVASVNQRSGSVRDRDRPSDTGTLDRSRSQLRSRMLSKTISARSTRWSDGRMEDVAISATKGQKVPGSSAAVLFQEAVDQVTGSTSATVVPSPGTSRLAEVNLDDSREGSPVRPATEQTAEGGAKKKEKGHAGFVGFVLEIWLWLQFVLIILVFVWAMARRGPRNVLKEAERKRA